MSSKPRNRDIGNTGLNLEDRDLKSEHKQKQDTDKCGLWNEKGLSIVSEELLEKFANYEDVDCGLLEYSPLYSKTMRLDSEEMYTDNLSNSFDTSSGNYENQILQCDDSRDSETGKDDDLINVVMDSILSRQYSKEEFKRPSRELYEYDFHSYEKWLKRLTLVFGCSCNPFNRPIKVRNMRLVDPRIHRRFEKNFLRMRKLMGLIKRLKDRFEEEEIQTVSVPSSTDLQSENIVLRGKKVRPTNLQKGSCNLSQRGVTQESKNSFLYNNILSEVRESNKYFGWFLSCPSSKIPTDDTIEGIDNRSLNLGLNYLNEVSLKDDGKLYKAFKSYRLRIQRDPFLTFFQSICKEEGMSSVSLENMYLLEKFKLNYINGFKVVSDGSKKNLHPVISMFSDHCYNNNESENIGNKANAEEERFYERKREWKFFKEELNQHAYEVFACDDCETCDFSEWTRIINRISHISERPLYPCDFQGHYMTTKEDINPKNKTTPEPLLFKVGKSRILRSYDENYFIKTDFNKKQLKLNEPLVDSDEETQFNGICRPDMDGKVEFFFGKRHKRAHRKHNTELSDIYFRKSERSHNFVEQINVSSGRYMNDREKIHKYLKYKVRKIQRRMKRSKSQNYEVKHSSSRLNSQNIGKIPTSTSFTGSCDKESKVKCENRSNSNASFTVDSEPSEDSSNESLSYSLSDLGSERGESEPLSSIEYGGLSGSSQSAERYSFESESESQSLDSNIEGEKRHDKSTKVKASGTEYSSELYGCDDPDQLSTESSGSSITSEGLQYILNNCVSSSDEVESKLSMNSESSGSSGFTFSVDSDFVEKRNVQSERKISDVRNEDDEQNSLNSSFQINHFFQNTDPYRIIQNHDKIKLQKNNLNSLQEIAGPRDRLFAGYTLPKFFPDIEIKENCKCLQIETVSSKTFIRTGFDVECTTSDANNESLNSKNSKNLGRIQFFNAYERDKYYSESSILQLLLLPFMLKICRITPTNPLSLLFLDFSEDIRDLDAGVLSFFCLRTQNIVQEASDDDIVDTKILFNSLLNQKTGFKTIGNWRRCLTYVFPDQTQDENEFAEVLEGLERNEKNFLQPFLRRKMLGTPLPIQEGIDYFTFLSGCAKEILLYSNIYSSPTFSDSLVFESDRLYRDRKVAISNRPKTVYCWYYSDTVSRQDSITKLDDSVGTNNEKLCDSEIDLDIDSSVFGTIKEVQFLTVAMIDAECSSWEEPFYLGGCIGNVEEAAAYHTESEEELPCSRNQPDELSSESESVSFNSSYSSVEYVEHGKENVNDGSCKFEQFSIPAMHTLPKTELDYTPFVLQMRDDRLNKEVNSNNAPSIQLTELRQEKSKGALDIGTFENEMDNDYDFELDTDYLRIKKITMHESMVPLDRDKCTLSLLEYEELDNYIFNDLLFPCCIFNNPRDWYAFARPSDKPLTGPMSRPFKNVYETSCCSSLLVGDNVVSKPPGLSPLNRYAVSVKRIKTLLEPLYVEFLNQLDSELVAEHKFQARETERAIILSRAAADEKDKKAARDSQQSSSDILHIIPKEPVDNQYVKKQHPRQSLTETKNNGKIDDAFEIVQHKCDGSSTESSSTFGRLEATCSKPSSIITFTHGDIVSEESFGYSCSPHIEDQSKFSSSSGVCLTKTYAHEKQNKCFAIQNKCHFNNRKMYRDSLTKKSGKEVNEIEDVNHFNVRLCKFPLSAAFGKIYDKYLFWVLRSRMDEWNSLQEAMEYSFPGWKSRTYILKGGLQQQNYSFIDKLHGHYRVTKQDLLRPEHDLRPYQEFYGAEHRHWLSLDMFFDLHLRDPRADLRSYEELLEGMVDDEGFEFCSTGVAWIPVSPPKDKERDFFGDFKMVECEWQRVLVYDYLPKEEAFLVLPTSLEYGPTLVTRAYLVFHFENNDLAAARIYEAVTERAIAEEKLRTFLFFNFSEPFLANEDTPVLYEDLMPECELVIKKATKLKHDIPTIYPSPTKREVELKSSCSDVRTLEFFKPSRALIKTNKKMIDLRNKMKFLRQSSHYRRVKLLKAQERIFGQDYLRKRNIFMVRSFLRAESKKTKGPETTDKHKKKKRKLKRPPPKDFYRRKQCFKPRGRPWKLNVFTKLYNDPHIKLISPGISDSKLNDSRFNISSIKKSLKKKERARSKQEPPPVLFRDRIDYYEEIPFLVEEPNKSSTKTHKNKTDEIQIDDFTATNLIGKDDLSKLLDNEKSEETSVNKSFTGSVKDLSSTSSWLSSSTPSSASLGPQEEQTFTRSLIDTELKNLNWTKLYPPKRREQITVKKPIKFQLKKKKETNDPIRKPIKFKKTIDGKDLIIKGMNKSFVEKPVFMAKVEVDRDVSPSKYKKPLASDKKPARDAEFDRRIRKHELLKQMYKQLREVKERVASYIQDVVNKERLKKNTSQILNLHDKIDDAQEIDYTIRKGQLPSSTPRTLVFDGALPRKASINKNESEIISPQMVRSKRKINPFFKKVYDPNTSQVRSGSTSRLEFDGFKKASTCSVDDTLEEEASDPTRTEIFESCTDRSISLSEEPAMGRNTSTFKRRNSPRRIPSNITVVTTHTEHLFKNKYQETSVLPYVAETLKPTIKCILKEVPLQVENIPSPHERFDLLWELVDEISPEGWEYGAKNQLIYEFLKGYISVLDKPSHTPSVFAKFIGDFQKSSYASYHSNIYVKDKVEKEASRVKGLALLHYMTLKERTWKYSKYVNDWDLEILPQKTPTVKMLIHPCKQYDDKNLQEEQSTNYIIRGVCKSDSTPIIERMCPKKHPQKKTITENVIQSIILESKDYMDSIFRNQSPENNNISKNTELKQNPEYKWTPLINDSISLPIKAIHLQKPEIIEPKRLCVKYSRNCYEQAKSAFRETYLYIRPDMYTLFEKHRNACFHLMNMRVIYTPKMKKCRHLSMFVEISTEHTENVIKELCYTRNIMLQNIEAFLDKHNIGSYMKYYRKNDFSSNLKSERLVRFFTFLLSEALRTCLKDSIKQFEYLVETVMGKVEKVGEDYVWGSNLNSKRFQGSLYHPFFKHKLSLEETAHIFADLDSYEEKIMDAIWAPLEMMVQIGPLNPMPISANLWPPDYMIKSYGLEEKVVVKAMKRIKVLIHKNIIALRAFIKEFEKDAEIWNLNAYEYAKDFVMKNSDIEIIGNEINLHRSEGKRIMTRIPYNIIIGMFEISTRWMAENLRERRFKIADYIAQFFTASLLEGTNYFNKRFTEMYTELVKKPKTIDDLLATEQKVHEAYKNSQKMLPEIQQFFAKYEMLHEFRVILEENEVAEIGEIMLWPSRINLLYYDTTHHNLPQMKVVLIECQKYYEDRFIGEIEELAIKLEKLTKQTDIKQAQETYVTIKEIQETVDQYLEKARLFKTRRELFGIRPREFPQLAQLTKDFEPYKTLWINVIEWRESRKAWFQNEVGKTNPDLQEAKFNDCYRMASRNIRDFKSYPELQEIATSIRDEMDRFRIFMPIFQYLHAPLKDRHWDVIESNTGVNLHNVQNIPFSVCLERGILKIVETLKEWSENAHREYTIECGLMKIIKDWDEAKMVLTPYHRKLKYFTMKITDEHLQLLDDHRSLLLQLLYSPFRGVFEEDLLTWEKKLRVCTDTVYKLLECQKIWLYLEPIFSSPDIREQLPSETGLFSGAQSYWKYFMKLAGRRDNIMAFAGDKRLLRQADNCFGKFHQAMLGLNKYMEGKRQAFPRFYFLSDEELVDMLSQAKNPLAVQPHLRKCFENIHKLSFQKDLRIVAMSSLEGEYVKMAPSMYPDGILEGWLNKLEDVMKQTVRVNIYHALVAIAHTERNKWILQWPGQVVIAGSQTIWTARIERGIQKNLMKPYFQKYLEMLDGLRAVIRGELLKVQRQVVSSLIVIEVHARDVFENLVKLNISNVKEFDWISQLRYYWMNRDLKVKAMNAIFKYGYEYLGNSGRLVITPLTDRCYLTLTGALHLKFGGAPAGPAGTGKTETTKDLAKAIAIQCVVFNCSDQLDYKAMGKFFKGLAGSGAWACFDEFNRIDIEVLSVVAQQITTIQLAQFAQASSCLFEGAWIKLKPECAVFITMNPGYAGRTELPDNLKALFRPVAMMVPDYTLIAEISLFSFGFSDSRELAGKITTTFKLSSEQLSTQDHYDFGMRAVKTVIAVAGNLKREHPKMDERQIILRALNDVNVPKFLTDDLKLFRGIVSDLFPLMEAQAIDYGSFKKSLKWVTFRHFKLQPVNDYITKVIQLYETFVVRHGLMLVGPAGSGKTKCYEILQKTMTHCKGQLSPSGSLFTRVKTYVLNPKSITMGQLYGEVDINTLEWSDGILPFYARKGAIASNDHKRWYVFDGPVDAVWIENMNTVLDDNKKLCMTSGEVIKMSDHMTMVFEVADLAVASPATVSRCGMVYLEPGVLGLEPYIDAWIRRLPRMAKPFASRFRVLLKRYTLNGLKFMRKNLVEFVPSMDTNILQSCFRLLNTFLLPLKLRDTGRKPSNNVIFQIRVSMTGWVVFSTLWSVGATCDDRSRGQFSEYMKYKISKHHAFPRNPKKSLYDYNFSDGGFSDVQKRSFKLPRWVSWTSNVAEYIIRRDMNYSDIEVPTIDNIRSANLVGRLLEAFCDVLCVGPTGTGKSVTIMSKLTRNMPKDFVVDFMTFSARTTARQTQEVIEAKLEKLKKHIRGAPRGKVQVLFIDDFNMPALETYGAQPPLELIRQFMDFGGWYSLTEVGQFLKIADVTLVAAIGPPGGGRNPVSARLLRHFHYIAFPDLSYVSKKMIFGTILLSWLERVKIPDKYSFGLKVLGMTLDIYATIEKELLPTPAKTHYTFNLRDLSKVFQGILMAKAETYQEVNEFLILWFHEHCRVYGDRLVNDEDNEWFEEMLTSKVKEHLDRDLKWAIGIQKRDSHTGKYHYVKQHIVFADFLSPYDDKCYERIIKLNQLKKVLEIFLYSYNLSTKNPMDLVLFEDAVCHVCKIARIIRQPLGNALLLGLAGSGRQSLTRLAAASMEYSCFQVELTRGYSMNDWREDLKKMMMGAGVYKKDTVFLFSDTQVKFEGFLEDLNNVLNSGDVPNIYQIEDKDLIMGAVRNEAIEMGITPTYPNLFSYYLKQIKARLHSVVTMSPIGELFRARLRQFPALVNCCTIDWFSEWPEAALLRVGIRFIKRATQALRMPSFLIRPIVESCIFIHRNVLRNRDLYLQECARQVYITPSHYLEFLQTFVTLCEDKVEKNYSEIKRLSEGIVKLTNTEDEMAELQETILRAEPELIRQGKTALKMLDYIEKSKAAAMIKQKKIKLSERKIAEMTKIVAEITFEAKWKLAVAMPELLAAKEELKTLNKNDLSEIKSLAKPPPGVRLTMEAVCVMLSVKPVLVTEEGGFAKKADFWVPAQRLLSDPGKFQQMLLKFKVDNLPFSVLQKIKKYINDPEFEPEKIKKASNACMSLCKWVYAMVKYYYVNKDVAPKIKALKDAKKLMRKMAAQLRHANKLMKNIQDRIETLEQTLENTHLKRKRIEENIEYSKNRQKKAKRLVKSLGNEKDRWCEKQMKLMFLTRFFFGDFLAGSGLIAYLGPFTSKYRNQMMEFWYEVMVSTSTPYIYKDGEFVKALCSSLKIENWVINGLPRDSFSVENGVIVECSRRWPLFIDPQKQANKWLKKTYKENIMVIKMDDYNFKDLLSGAIINGIVLLVETNTCELDPSLDPVLLKQTFFQGRRKLIKLGDLLLPYHDNFRFYITTTLPNPALTPDVFIKLAVINFTLSATGLQEQLIGLTVQNEIPGLERYKVRLIESTAKLKEQIRSLQDLILKLIRETTSPVDDRRLKDTLQISKIITQKSRIKISAANKAKRILDEVRVKYSIIAIKGQLLFFCVSELSAVDPMYQYSLDWFIDIFNKTLVTTSKVEKEEDTLKESTMSKEPSQIKERIGSQAPNGDLESEDEHSSFASEVRCISFIDYKPPTQDFDTSSKEAPVEGLESTDINLETEYNKALYKQYQRGSSLKKHSQKISTRSRQSDRRSEKISRNTFLLWKKQNQKGRKKRKPISHKRKNSSKKSLTSEQKESIKKMQEHLIEGTVRHKSRGKTSENSEKERHCLKVAQIMEGHKKSMLELRVELKIIRLRRKLLITRSNKKIQLDEQFRKKVKRMHHQSHETSTGERMKEAARARTAILDLLKTSSGRDKLRAQLSKTVPKRSLIVDDPKGTDYKVRERCKSVSTELTYNVYTNVCRSLFEKHKVIFAFLLSIRLMKANRRVDPKEWSFFLTGDIPKQDIPMPGDAPWMSERIWKDTLSLGNLKSFKPFVNDFVKNYGQYKFIVDAKEPHLEPLPAPWAENFTIVQRLLVLKCLRYDRLIDAMYDFVKVSFGYEFIEPQVTEISAMYGDSSPSIPLIFILSPGTDPANDLYNFSKKLSMASKFHSISLGQGQGVIAEKMFKKALAEGHWVFFQNCHLAPSWMPTLESLIENVDPDFTNKNFRVWLTSLPSPSFPVGVLQKSSKVTMEPPRGVKANLLRAYAGQVNEFKDIVNNTDSPKAELFRSLLFSICLFHGVILERRKYGSLGFNNKYEFTDGDLRICISQLRMFLDEYTDIPFKVLKYTAGQINYGGRITDDWDRRCITHLLEDYYNSDALLNTYIFDSRRWYKQQPPGTNLEKYIKYIQSIPSIDYPELFGLHENASINYAFKETNLCFEVLLDLHPSVGAGDSDKDKEKVISEKVSALLEIIPPFYDNKALMSIKLRFPVMYTESLNTVLVQEVLRYNNLLKVIHRSLFDLTRAISGTVVMSEALEKMCRSLLSNRVPEMWAGKAYPSLKALAAWVLDLKNRLQFIESWHLQGKLEKYWISGLYFPQAFLTACLQNHARRHILPIDSLSFRYEVMPKKKYEDSSLIFGLFMEGARWDSKKSVIGESLPKVLYTEMPDIALIPEQFHVKTLGSYICPVYKTLLRAGTLSTTGHSTNFILAIEVPSEHPEGHWVKRSVALFTAVED